MQYTQCGRYLITNGCDGNSSLGEVGYTGKIRRWDAFSGALLPTHYSTGWASTLPFDIAFVEDPVAGPSGDKMVTPHGQEGSIALSALHGRQSDSVGVLTAHFGRITAVAYRSQYQQLISAAADGLLNVWAPKPSLTTTDDDEDEESIPWRRKQKRPKTKHRTHEVTSDETPAVSHSSAQATPQAESNTEFLPPIIRSYLEDVQRQSMVATFTAAAAVGSSSSGSTL